MTNLTISLDCGPYDRTEALRTGDVRPSGIDLTYVVPTATRQVFARMARNEAFDLAEMAAMYALVRLAQDADSGDPPFVALPVFASRSFRHGYIFVHADARIEHPKDLEGRRVGVSQYRNTASIWIRGILQDEYGVDLDTIEWFEGGVNAPDAPSALLHLDMHRPVEPARIGPEETLSSLLEDRQLDAVMTPRVPDSAASGRVRRLFEDYPAEERRYYRRTGVFPIMHLIVMRRSLHLQHPWVAESMYDAFVQAKAHAQSLLHRSGALRTMLPWQLQAVEEMDQFFEGDPWAYGLEPNRDTLETLLRYLEQQGFIASAPDPAQLFIPVIETAH